MPNYSLSLLNFNNVDKTVHNSKTSPTTPSEAVINPTNPATSNLTPHIKPQRTSTAISNASKAILEDPWKATQTTHFHSTIPRQYHEEKLRNHIEINKKPIFQWYIQCLVTEPGWSVYSVHSRMEPLLMLAMAFYLQDKRDKLQKRKIEIYLQCHVNQQSVDQINNLLNSYCEDIIQKPIKAASVDTHMASHLTEDVRSKYPLATKKIDMRCELRRIIQECEEAARGMEQKNYNLLEKQQAGAFIKLIPNLHTVLEKDSWGTHTPFLEKDLIDTLRSYQKTLPKDTRFFRRICKAIDCIIFYCTLTYVKNLIERRAYYTSVETQIESLEENIKETIKFYNPHGMQNNDGYAQLVNQEDSLTEIKEDVNASLIRNRHRG